MGGAPAVLAPGLPGFDLDAANCRDGDPDLFFSDARHEQEYAKRVCAGCQVLDDCRTYATARPGLWGVWGGLTRDERAARAARLDAGPATVTAAATWVDCAAPWCDQQFLTSTGRPDRRYCSKSCSARVNGYQQRSGEAA